jgi:phage gp46-like protein
MTALPQPVYELAGSQDDPVVEDVLASLFTDAPVREVERPGDTRQHWTWAARAVDGSRVWLSFAQPLTDDTAGLIQQRAQASLAWMVPRVAKEVEVSARQVSCDTVVLGVKVRRPDTTTIDLSFTLPGGPGA